MKGKKEESGRVTGVREKGGKENVEKRKEGKREEKIG